jgi:hypothetical protein
MASGFRPLLRGRIPPAGQRDVPAHKNPPPKFPMKPGDGVNDLNTSEAYLPSGFFAAEMRSPTSPYLQRYAFPLFGIEPPIFVLVAFLPTISSKILLLFR